MPYIYAVLVFLALALASPILKQSSPTAVTGLDLPWTAKTVYGIISGRGYIAATTTHSPKVIAISSTNVTAQRPVSSTSPSNETSAPLQQSQWGPGDISNILFGCVASIFGAATIGLIYYLYRQPSRSQHSDESVEMDDIPVLEPSDHDGVPPLEDHPPSYTPIDASAGSLGQ